MWMCNVDDVAKLPTQSPYVADSAAIVQLATAARECKSRGNVQFQAGDFSAAELSYSDGMLPCIRFIRHRVPVALLRCCVLWAVSLTPEITAGDIAGAKSIAKCSEESVWGQRFRAVLLTNRAAARARQQHWLDALADCHLALRLHPLYLKALKRRGDLYQVSERSCLAIHPTFRFCSAHTNVCHTNSKGQGGAHADNCVCVTFRQALGLCAEAAADFEAVCTAAERYVQDRSLGTSARSAMSACTRSVRLEVRPMTNCCPRARELP